MSIPGDHAERMRRVAVGAAGLPAQWLAAREPLPA